MLEQRSAPAGAEKKSASPFVFDDVQGPINWREGISAPVPTKHTDLLALQYPRYATQLNEARGEGYTDEEILQFLGGREAEALLYYPIQEVNSYLGRTGKTMQEAAQTHWDSQRAAYAKITGKSEEDVEERMKAGQLIGVPASTLLIDDALYEKLTPHIKKTEAWTETLANGVRLENVQRQISDIGYQLMMFQNVPDWEKQVEALEAQQRALQPALRTGGLVRAAQGAIKIAAQMGNTGFRALPYAGAGALLGAAAGSTGGPLGSGITATGGFATGMVFGSTLEMFKMEAGSAYLDLIRTKDKEGRGMDPTLARGAALGVGLINAALENLQLRTVVENIPGGKAVLEALRGSGAKRLMNVPTIRGALLRLGKEKIEDITEESFQEMAQEIVPIVAGELAKSISGREFEHVSVEDAVKQVLEVGKETAQSMSLLFVPGAVTQGIGMARDVQRARSGVDAAAGAAGVTPEAPAKVSEGEAVVQGQPADGLGKNAEAGAEEAETSVYLPVAALEQYAQTHPGELEDLGVDLTPLEGMDEVRMTEAQFASLSEELPELAEAVRNDVRRGAKGATAREAGEIVLRRSSRPAWRTAETDAVAEELERKMLAVGKDREEARAFARVGASVAGMLAQRANISPADAMKLTFRRGEDAVQGEGFAQPVNAGVDLGQKVPILDLSGVEGTSTTKELLTRLKDLALKDETWISRDAEVFATLPRGKKLRHIAYSSRSPHLENNRALRNDITGGLNDLVQNAVLIESVPNNDPKKADVLNFHRLYVPVRTDAGVQAVRIVAEELKNSDRLRPTDVELYDVILEGEKESPDSTRPSLAGGVVTHPGAPFEIPPRLSVASPEGTPAERQLRKPEESPAVSHGLLAEEVVPSPGAPSEITIADMLRGVKDAEGRPYVGEEYRQIGTKRKNEMDASLAKHRPDLTPEQRADAISEIEKLGEEVKAGGSPKHEKAATKWLLGGHIILPEDNYKILDALKICEQQHLDPMSFSDPNEILAKYTIKESAAEKRVNPDTVSEFSDKKEYPDGITVYAVQNDKAGQAAVRKIIDTHWGEDANPWCLAARGKRGGMGDAWKMWRHYNAIPKRIAFRNGKLLALCASDKKETEWWNREDESFSAIPYSSKGSDGVIVYGYHEDLGHSSKVKEKLKDGTVREFFPNNQIREERLPDKTIRKWYPSGQMEEEFFLGGTYTAWYESGQKRYEALPDKATRKWYENGQIEYERLPDGTSREWSFYGDILKEKLPDGTHIEWTWGHGPRGKGLLVTERLPDGTGRAWELTSAREIKQMPNEAKLDFIKSKQPKYIISPDGTWREYEQDTEVYNQSTYNGSPRQSEDYDPGDPKTWPEGPARDEALDLLSDIEVLRIGAMHPNTWTHDERRAKEALEILRRRDRLGDVKQDPHTWTEGDRKDDALTYQEMLGEDGEIELDPNTWMAESPYKREAIEAQEKYDDEELARLRELEMERIQEAIDELREAEFEAVDDEMNRLDDRYSALEDKESNAMMAEAEDLQERLDELIERRSEEYYQIIGKRGAEALDAAEEGTTRLDNLNVAREMEQAGKDVKTIRLATGWERGADGKWRHEIPDGDLNLFRIFDTPEKRRYHLLLLKKQNKTLSRAENRDLEAANKAWTEGNRTGQKFRLGDVYNAPELFAAYPDLADIRVRLYADNVGFGEYSHKHNRIIISLNNVYHPDATEGLQFKDTLAHEIQHAIQEREGFQRGSNPLKAGGHEQYERVAGEVEARNAGRRVYMTDKERRERLLAETEDVAREDQIILEGMMETAMAYSTPQADTAENIRRAPLTFKLTGKPVSKEYMAALEKLEAGEPVAAEEYDAIPEIQDARSRTATGSTLDMPDREAIRQQVYDKLMSYGSAVTEVVDGRERTVYNGEVRNDRRADIIIGLPASGKSSALVDPISSKYKSMLIDSDEAKKLIPEFDDGFGAGYVHEESKRIVADVTENATDEGRNVVVPIVGSSYSKLEKRYIDDLRQKGYKVYVHMADIDPNVAAGRNLRRFAETGRFVDLKATSFKYGNKPREVFERVKKEGIADGYSRIDTTVFPGRQVEGTEDISHDRGNLRERRGGVLGEDSRNQGRESSQAGAAGGAAAELGTEGAGGTSRMGTAPRGVSGRSGDINARLTVQPDGMSLIEFFESANRSTSFHELAHHVFRMLDELSRVEGADPQLRADVDEVLQHAGVTREDFDSEDAAVRKRARTQAHEYFAQGFETYIAEGRAPSRALRGVFRRLRAWMIEVYHDVVQALGIELSPEMRDIYARLLATPEEITAETTVQELAVEDAAIKEEIKRYQAVLRERSEQEQLGYEASDDWSFYEVPEDAEEAVTGWLGQLEEYEFKRNAHEAVQNVARIIRENGGLRFGDFIVQLGEDLARDVRKRWPGLFRNTTDGPQLALDVLTQTLQENGIDLDVQGLVDWLQENVNEVVKKPAPLVEVNADTLNALVEHLGVDGAREYMTDRRRDLTRLQKALQAEYDQDKNNAQVKADLEATYREQREIAESVKALDGTLSAEGDVVPERTMEPVALTPESGRSIDEADDSELLMLPDGSTELGRIDDEVAQAAGIPAGEIRANVGAVRHTEEGHGGEILGSGYPDVETFFFDVLSGYERVYRGNNDSLLLTKPLGAHHAVAAIELVNEDGVYRAKTGWTIRERKLNKKELLFARSEPLATDPGAGVVSRTGPDGNREGAAPTARQKSNSSATVPPGKAGVNTTLTLSEAMRRGYAMAEKYSKAAWRQGVKEGRAKGRAAVEARIAALKQRLQERQEVKAEVGELVKGINRMAGSETVTWAAHKEIEQLLSSYDLKRRSKKTMEHRAEVTQWLREDPELAEALNEKDTAHLGETTLNEMTLDDLRALNDQVQQIYDRGAEEYRIWDLERTERKDTIYTDLRDTLEKRKVNLPKVVTGPEDLKKQYKGIRGKLAKAKDWTYAVTLTKDRLFDWFDGGRTGYRGPFVKYFVDMTAAARDESLRHIQARRKWVETRLRELGFRVSDFARIATTYDGKDYTWSEIQEIYMGLRNEKKAQAILNGNFKNSADPSGDAAYLISLLSEEHKRAAELVAEDHNRNVDRIEAGMIAAYQKGMERETDYTSIHRLERVSSMGLIDAESDEALMNGLSNADVLRRVEDGFMKKRVEMKAENQTPIHLGLWENWHSDVARHEHAAAMAVAARNLAGALLTRDPKNGKTLGRMIKERFGDEAWHTLVSFFNDDVMDDTRLAHNVLDGLCSFMARNMSIAYLAGNLATVLKQTTSIPRFLITAGPRRILVALGHFLTRGPKFLEEVYAMDPQLRERNGSPLLAMIREGPQWGKRMVQRGLDWLLEPISMVDRWVAAIGWKATYDANVKTLGHEAAVREAQRAVRLTQQPASAREAARMWQQNGFVRLSMVFTSDAASTFGMTAYDLVQQLRGGKVGKVFMTLTALAITGVLMKAANEGLPDDEDDDEEGRNWALEAFTEQAIASIPLVGKEAMLFYDSMRGKYRGTQYSAFMAPVVKLAQTYHLLNKEDSDEEDQRRATWLALEAFSLSGAAPIPVTGMRRIVQSMELAKEDGMAAALNLVGIRRRLE